MKPTLPTFVIIGASKCGTTSLARYLAAHPDVFVTTPKEPDFFHPDRSWRRGREWYERLFDGGRTASARGEASTCYTWAPHVPDVPQRMAGVIPDARLVYLVREPVERIRSMYLHDLDRGRVSAPLDEVVTRDSVYVDASRYGYQIDTYLDWYPRERLLVVSSDDLRGNRLATLRRILTFLGVDPDAPVAGIEREFQTRAAKRRAVGPARALEASRVRVRGSAWYRRSPALVKRGLMAVRRGLSRPLRAEDGALTPDLARRLEEWLADDRERLRQHVPAGFAAWLDAAPTEVAT